MKVNGTLKTVSYKYDFAIDGGSVGDKPSGIFLPGNIRTMGAFIFPVTDLASSGGAAIVYVNTTIGSTIVDNVASGAAGTYTDYNSATYGFVLHDSHLQPAYIAISQNGGFANTLGATSVQVVTSIFNHPLTAGAFICTIMYMDFN